MVAGPAERLVPGPGGLPAGPRARVSNGRRVVSGRTASTTAACHPASGMTDRRRVWFSPAAGGRLARVRQPLGKGRNIVRVHVVAPEGFDDPGQPSGGNIYDRRVCAGLAEAGWDVLVTTVAGTWPVPGPGARACLARIVSDIPDGASVLIDGLIASPAAAQLLPPTGRIRMTAPQHMPPATAPDTHQDARAEPAERAV